MTAKVNSTYLNLRKTLGLLGLLLPLILVAGNSFDVKQSISHFYYTRVGGVFVGVLFAFGLFLFSYRGYDKKEKELLSDNLLTNLAGLFAIVAALIPTACMCDWCVICANGHENCYLSKIHGIGAGGFFILMGWMSYFQFTKTGQDKGAIDLVKKNRNRIYRICGIGIWLAVVFLGIRLNTDFCLSKYDVFIGETIALLFFGVAWLVKGETLKRFGL